MSKKVYRSDALRSAHAVADDLYAIGAIDKTTMRRFDKACLAGQPNALAKQTGCRER